MKVTAIIDDKTIKDAMKYSKATTVTETLKVALNEYIRNQKLKDLGRLVKKQPMYFENTAEEIRNLNREG
ncbi:MAG: type II toxin-antitoxin system VapB family antitoxin [Bacteroidales bacterium]